MGTSHSGTLYNIHLTHIRDIGCPQMGRPLLPISEI